MFWVVIGVAIILVIIGIVFEVKGKKTSAAILTWIFALFSFVIGAIFLLPNTNRTPESFSSVASNNTATTTQKNAGQPTTTFRTTSQFEIYNIQALTFLNSGNYADAAEAFGKAIDADYDAAKEYSIFLRQGEAYRKAEEYEKAVDALSFSIRVSPASLVIAYEERARARYALGQIDLAKSDIAKAVEIHYSEPVDPKDIVVSEDLFILFKYDYHFNMK